MHRLYRSFILLLALVQSCNCKRIAVIGSGIGGSSAALFLHEKAPDAEIVVFEKNATAGGRTHSTHFDGMVIDVGATSISSVNQYLTTFVHQFNISTSDDSQGRPAAPSAAPSPAVDDDLLGIWDGAKFPFFTSTANAIEMLAKMVWRYGFSPYKVLPAVRGTVAKYKKIYDVQARNASFANPRALLEAVGLYDLTQQSAYEYFAALGVDARFVHEFVDGASRDNYNQNGTINAFVDLVSLAGAGIDGSVFTLPSGTEQVSAKVLEASRSRVETSTPVAGVSECRGPGQAKFCLTGEASAGAEPPLLGDFDAVVIASPLEVAGLALPEAVGPVPRREYQPVHVTFVAGALSKAYFGLGPHRAAPGTILTVAAVGSLFSCVGYHGRSPRGHDVFKVFSVVQLPPATVDLLFDQVVDLRRFYWPEAYPKLQPSGLWPQFELMEGLVYLNAMESAVSCMEFAIIAAMNGALLLLQNHTRPPFLEDPPIDGPIGAAHRANWMMGSSQIQ